MAIRKHHPNRIVFAVPVCSRSIGRVIDELADEIICLHAPVRFYNVGSWYEHFSQVTDEEVIAILATQKQRQARASLVH